MDAIRFEPNVSAAFSTDRRPDGGGDLFADMLGEQMKKRVDTERDVPVTRRRQSPERRATDQPRADNPQAEGRPIRPVIKHQNTIRGEAKRIDEGQPALAARKAEETGMDAEACATVTPVEQEDPAAEQPTPDQPTPDQPGAETGAEIVPTVEAETAAPAAEAQPVIVAPVIEDMAGEPVAEEILVPGEAGELAPAEDAAPAAAAGEEEVPTAAGFAAALAASQAETAADLLGSEDAAQATAAELQNTTAPDLTTLKVAVEAAAAAQPAPEQTAEAAVLTTKVTPEAPRPAEPTKTRPARAVPASEIKAQQPVPAQAPQPQVPASQPQAVTPASTFGEAGPTPFATSLDGDGMTMPGWGLHLAQGAAGKRPDFIAQLRQQLRDLPAHEQVAVNIQRAVREGTGRISIQLSPVELGQIHVKLDIDEEKRVTAAVTVEKPSTLELLQKDVKALERALQEAGLKMDGNDLSFSLGRQDGKEFAQDLGNSGRAGIGGAEGEAQDEAEIQAGVVAEINTAAGLVNLEI
jgi:flagellar hook-length control protein FliK